MDASLYLLFRAIRDHSTVALSGESADEVFGGYLQFFDEEALRADTFPGREKTLLREATADVLPQSVYDRVKSPTRPPRTPSTRQPSRTRPSTCSPAPATPSSTSSTPAACGGPPNGRRR
ncbi:hypothetical protein SUDANB43_07376 [Streptomyces sp. enrichment culture]